MSPEEKIIAAFGGAGLAFFGVYKAVNEWQLANEVQTKALAAPADSQALVEYHAAEAKYRQAAYAYGFVAAIGLGLLAYSLWPSQKSSRHRRRAHRQPNPLRRGSSREVISANIRKLKREHPSWSHKRVIAAALNNARRTGKKK
jgi:hypothetical protein